MAGLYGLSREAVRVKVKKCEGILAPEWRKFSVDPQITSLEVLYSILAKAFDLKTDFSICYKTVDPNGQDVYLAVLSDWDLDAAFLRAHNFSISMGTDPCLNLKVDIKPFSETSDWDTSSTSKEISPLQQSIGVGQKYVQNMQTRLPGLIMNQMEKTFSMVTRALNFVEDQSILPTIRQPLSDSEFRTFLDSVGQIVQPHILRNVICGGGIDPSLRRVVWKHILNVYPDGMTGRERMDYMKRKAAEYFRLRDIWRTAVQQGPVTGELAYVTSMVRKDVLRTDRLHPFYAGNDDNQNIASLFNILTTYALNHPAVSYCQGMSDIASPLLVTMSDEAQAYICFCAVMKRLSTNFLLDGIAMTQKFSHLSEALQFYDPEFHDYLKLQQADDLLFCYRWLLLEMKREFAFEDSLRMLEVLWSSLPPEPPVTELNLFEKEYIPPPVDLQPPPKSPLAAVIMRRPRENAYTTLCALRRQSSSQSLVPTSPNALKTSESYGLKLNLDSTKRLNQSLDENITRNPVVSGRNVSKCYQSLDETKMRNIDQNCVTQKTDPHERPFNRLEVKNNEKNQQLSRSSSPLDRSNASNESMSITPNESKSPSKTCVHSNHIHQHYNHSGEQLGKTIGIHGTSNGGGHFKDLKERITAGKKEIFASFDKLENFQLSNEGNDSNENSAASAAGGKIVKNFNEFLNFASNKSVQLSLNRSNSVNSNESVTKPTLRMTKSSLYELNSIKFDGSNNFNKVDNDGQEVETCANKKTLQLQLAEKRQLSFDGSSPDDSQEYFPMTTSITRELRLEFDNLNRQVFGNSFTSQFNSSTRDNCNANDAIECNSPESADSHISNNKSPAILSLEISYTKLNQNSTDVEDEQHLDKIYRYPSDKNLMKESKIYQCPSDRSRMNEIDVGNEIVSNQCQDDFTAMKRASTASGNMDVFVWENPLHQLSPTTTTITSVAPTIKDISNNNEKNPFYAKDFLQTLTPDEQIDLEYDGEIIDESCMGKKLITPIRLLRKSTDEIGAAATSALFRSSNNSSKRSSTIYGNDSDSDSSNAADASDKHSQFSENENILMKTSTLTETNPFLMDIAATYAASNVTPIINDSCNNQISTPIDEEASEAETNIVLRKVGTSLPPPTEFGGGNPFLMFLCLTLLLQHRNYVMKNNMDYNEMAMHFDKMVRKHNVVRVLNQARRMYAEYLKSQNIQHVVGGSNASSSSANINLSSSNRIGGVGVSADNNKISSDNSSSNCSNINKQNFKNDIRA